MGFCVRCGCDSNGVEHSRRYCDDCRHDLRSLGAKKANHRGPRKLRLFMRLGGANENTN